MISFCLYFEKKNFNTIRHLVKGNKHLLFQLLLIFSNLLVCFQLSSEPDVEDNETRQWRSSRKSTSWIRCTKNICRRYCHALIFVNVFRYAYWIEYMIFMLCDSPCLVDACMLAWIVLCFTYLLFLHVEVKEKRICFSFFMYSRTILCLVLMEFYIRCISIKCLSIMASCCPQIWGMGEWWESYKMHTRLYCNFRSIGMLVSVSPSVSRHNFGM